MDNKSEIKKLRTVLNTLLRKKYRTLEEEERIETLKWLIKDLNLDEDRE